MTDWVQVVVLPTIVGFIGALLSAFVSRIVERARMRRENNEMQIKMSIELCNKVINAMDELFALMNNHAWYIAWRKVTEGHYDYPGELLVEDQELWGKYRSSLQAWNKKQIAFETELKGSFGNTGYEAFLFLDGSRLIDQGVDMLSKIYYAPGPHISDDSIIPTFTFGKDGKAVMEKIIIDTSEAGQLKNMADYFALMDTLRARIASLSSTMIHCIQRQSVGTLAEAPEPVPEEHREEAKALLGEEVTRRYVAHTSLQDRLAKKFKFKKSAEYDYGKVTAPVGGATNFEP
mmetsp:Transcript_11023/g.16548  ORF Transcript_11023/g.16548 Transcript_11023/m.16548 type:complete len:290 (-) Transcript_11023:173-1042(-)